MSDVPIFGTLAPNTGSAAPVARAENVTGAFTTFADATARDLIPGGMLRTGQLCRLDSTGVFYKWSGSAWAVFTGFGGGGVAGIPMTFFASTVDGDPTPGGVRLNNATPASATSLFVDDVESKDGTNIRDLIASLANEIGAQVRLQSASAPANWILYRVGDYDPASGYGRLINLTVIDSSTTVTFTTTVSDTILSIDVGLPKDLGNKPVANARTVTLAGEVDDTIPGAGTRNIDWTAGHAHKATLNGNVTWTFTLPPAGQVMGIQVKVTQDTTGGRTITPPGGILGTAPVIDPTPTAVTFVGLFLDGTNVWWDHPLVKDSDVAVNANISAAKTDGDFGSKDIQSTGNFLVKGGFVRWGLPSGSGSGVRSAASIGDMRLPRGGWVTYGRDNVDGNDVLLQWWDAANSNWILGDASTFATGYIYLKLGLVQLRVGTNPTLDITSTKIQPRLATLSWEASITSAPILTQDDNSGGSATGKKMTVRAQSCTGLNSTGGAYDCGPGAGLLAGGLGRCVSGSGVARLSYNDIGWAYDGATIAAQPARIGQLTDSSGGSATGTISSVGASFSQTAFDNIHASLIAKINALELLVHNKGTTA
jgi:hypothetical protein